MSDIPEGALSRSARLAGLPLAMAGRLTLGWGQRMLGRDRHEVSAELQRRTAEQIFEVLGTLKGGAMKFGQALSVFEAAIPEEFAAPYREALTKLQSAAPPMAPRTIGRIMAEQLGTGWREHFREFDDVAAAAASIGQVHRGIWRDGREVAVKIQYPGAAAALRTDLDQLSRIAPMIGVLAPGLEVRPLIRELRERVMEEVDYAREADHQRAFADEFADDPHFWIPRVVASAPKVIVSEWVSATPLASIIATGTREQRNTAGRLLAEFHFSAPQRVGLLHSDPHPGNFQLTDDGRLVVLDFGSVAELPHGTPPIVGRASRLALSGDAEAVVAELRAEGFISDRFDLDPQEVMDYLVPFTEPLRHEEFHFTREWLRRRAATMTDLTSTEARMVRYLNLPPAYLMLDRVTFGSIGILCQLDARAPFRAIVERWLPGFADPA